MLKHILLKFLTFITEFFDEWGEDTNKNSKKYIFYNPFEKGLPHKIEKML